MSTHCLHLRSCQAPLGCLQSVCCCLSVGTGGGGLPRFPAHFCPHSLGSQYRSVQQKAAGSKRTLQQRYEVLKTENPGGGCLGHSLRLWVCRGGAGPRVYAVDEMAGAWQEVGGWVPSSLPGPHTPGPLSHLPVSSLPPQMPLTYKGGSCWLAWTRWPETWTGRKRPSQGSCGHRWSKAGPCRTVLSGPKTSRYLWVRSTGGAWGALH